jgi:hypothetical protein
MTRLTKIPMIAVFSAVIAAFGVSAEAFADRGDDRGRHYRSDNGRHQGHGQYHRRGIERHDQHRNHRAHRDYRGDRKHYATPHRGYDRDRRHHAHRPAYNHHRRDWDRNRYSHHRGYHGRHAGHRYDYHRHYRDRHYYHANRHHYRSWRPYHGPVWNGYRQAYWSNRGCHPVTRYWTWSGRPALVGGVQCYNPRGVGFVVSDSYFLLNYY